MLDSDACRRELAKRGYDPDDPVRGRPIPERLLAALARAPVIPERRIGALDSMRQARGYDAARRAGLHDRQSSRRT